MSNVRVHEMHQVLRFQTTLFDLSREPDNPINPIRGASFLEWLRTRVPADLKMSAPAAEDWGWYSYLDWHGRRYMVGSSADEDPAGNHEWLVQFDKSRSVKERLLGQGKLAADDPCVALIHGLIAQEPAFAGVAVERGP